MAKSPPKTKAKKKGLNATQLAAIFVVAVMALSTIAFSFLSNDSKQTETPPLDSGLPAGTPLQYSAETDANVTDLLPSFKLFAASSEVDIEKLDSLVSAVPGVIRVSSQFTQNSQNPNALIYAADVQFDKAETDLAAVTAAITTAMQGKLSEITVFSYALFEIPSKVAFTNADLNLTQNYVFADQLTQGLVFSITEKGDRVHVGMNATFTGSKLSGLTVYELSNYSLQPVDRVAARQLPILSLEPSLLVGADTNYAESLSVPALEQAVAGILDVNSSRFVIAPVAPLQLEINADFNTSAFSQFLDSLPEVSQHQAVSQEKPYQFALQLQDSNGYAPVVSAVRQELVAEGVFPEQVQFAPWLVRMQGQIGLTENGVGKAAAVAAQIQSALRPLLPDVTVYRIGSVQAEFIQESDADPNSPKFIVDGNRLPALLLPASTVGQQVLISLQYQTVRNKVTTASAIEVPAVPPA